MKYFEDEDINTEDSNSFENIEFMNCRFTHFDYANISFKNSRFIDCHFKNSNIGNANLLGCHLRDVQFSECKLTGINWSCTTAISQLSFYQCKMDYNIFQDLNLKGLKATQCQMKDSDFSNTQLEASSFIGSDLSQANFTRANLIKANFSEAINYFIDPDYTKIKDAQFDMPEAMSFFHAMGIKINP